MTTFPEPFGGITESVKLTPFELNIVLKHMANLCNKGHKHNIAVQFDGNIIHTTKFGIECVKEALGYGNFNMRS